MLPRNEPRVLARKSFCAGPRSRAVFHFGRRSLAIVGIKGPRVLFDGDPLPLTFTDAERRVVPGDETSRWDIHSQVQSLSWPGRAVVSRAIQSDSNRCGVILFGGGPLHSS